MIIFHFVVQTHYYDDAFAKQHTKPIQKFLGFGKVVLMLEQSPFWINNTRWWTKCTLRRQKVLSWHHFFKEGKITVSPQLTSKNRNSISKALSSLKFPCSFGIKGVPKVREQIIHPKSFKHWFLSQKMTLFWTPLSGQFCPESNPWRGRFYKRKLYFQSSEFWFSQQYPPKKSMWKFRNFLKIL